LNHIGFIGGEISVVGAFFSLSLIPEATQHEAEEVGLELEGVPWLTVFWLCHRTPAYSIISLELSLLNAIL